jgi:hypothetical protein
VAIKTAYSNNKNEKEAVNELKQKIYNEKDKIIIFFASSSFNQKKLNSEMFKAFPKTTIIGCSTAGELVSGKMLNNSIVVMSLSTDIVDDAKAVLVENIKEQNNIKKAFLSLEKYYNIKMSEMDPAKYVGIILTDGLAGAEEKLMETIGDLTNITFIGGAAGDDLKFKQTFVYANGESYSNTAILAVMHVPKGFDVIKTQSFDVLKKKLVVTKADEKNRQVIEFNNKPAVEEYARQLGVKSDKIADVFMHNPVGLMIGKEPYVRSPQKVVDTKICFYCNIKEGSDLSILASRDIVKDTKKAVEAKLKEIEGCEGMINFHCILRTLELNQKKQSEKYAKIFEKIPMIGFSTYGEEYVGHINQTSTILVFKRIE